MTVKLSYAWDAPSRLPKLSELERAANGEDVSSMKLAAQKKLEIERKLQFRRQEREQLEALATMGLYSP